MGSRTGSFHQAGIPALIEQGMGPCLHWFPEDVTLSRLAATLVGMANGDGGTILLGISPRSGQIQGISHPEEAIDRVFQAVLMSDPSLVIPLPKVNDLSETGDARVLSITVPAGLPHVYSLDGRFLGREGSQTNPLPARKLRQLLLERGAVQFESRVPYQACMEDLDEVKVQEYIETLNLTGGTRPEEILWRRGCLKRVDGEIRPTYAALLLFGKYPQQWLPNATFLAARFPGSGYSDSYTKQDISGTLPDQLRQAETFVLDQLRRMVSMVGLAHLEMMEYPYEAVRELLVNAVAHRDYNIQGDTIHLHIFADRLEVQSPGKLPGPVTLNNLLRARFSRNAVIVQVLSDLGFVERLGYGLDRVVSLMRQNNLRQPRFEEVVGSFRVTLYGSEVPLLPAKQPDLSAYCELGLNHRQELALSYLVIHRRITNSAYQELCPDVHPETLRRDMADLVKKGVLIKVGEKRATFYILK